MKIPQKATTEIELNSKYWTCWGKNPQIMVTEFPNPALLFCGGPRSASSWKSLQVWRIFVRRSLWDVLSPLWKAFCSHNPITDFLGIFVPLNSFRSPAGWVLLLRCLCLPWATAGFQFLSPHTSCSCAIPGVWGTSGILQGLKNRRKQCFLLHKAVNTALTLFFHSSALFTESTVCSRKS